MTEHTKMKMPDFAENPQMKIKLKETKTWISLILDQTKLLRLPL